MSMKFYIGKDEINVSTKGVDHIMHGEFYIVRNDEEAFTSYNDENRQDLVLRNEICKWYNSTIEDSITKLELPKGAKSKFIPTKIKFDPPWTIVWWADNTITRVKCAEDDEFDSETAFMIAYMKKMREDIGLSKTKYYKTLKGISNQWIEKKPHPKEIEHLSAEHTMTGTFKLTPTLAQEIHSAQEEISKAWSTVMSRYSTTNDVVNDISLDKNNCRYCDHYLDSAWDFPCNCCVRLPKNKEQKSGDGDYWEHLKLVPKDQK